MNYRKAISVIRQNYPKTTKMVNGRYQGGFDDHDSDFGQALDIACHALAKCSPMKPVKDGAFGRCRRCCYEYNSELVNEYGIKFCPNCGQALNWGD